jgi:glycosyltransferase involved in cell wall biosynthesis
VYNERRFIASCIEHLNEQGVAVYVIDNESSDETLAIAERYLGRGVIGVETLPRDDCFALRAQCERQEQLAQILDADWLIHHDADEIRVSPKRAQTLAAAIAELDEAGFNAADFVEFTFLPTRESPNHDHPNFQQTMRSYYPYSPFAPFRVNAWKRQDGPVDLVGKGGHQVHFPGLKISPQRLYMRHYLFLSVEHAMEKFVRRRYSPRELDMGWHGWRNSLAPEHFQLPSEAQLRRYEGDHLLDASKPRTLPLLQELMAAPSSSGGSRARLRRRLSGLPARAKRVLSRHRTALGS